MNDISIIPFDPNPPCPKCTSKDVAFALFPAIMGSKEDVPEFLGLTCRRCSYEWCMRCADTKETTQ